MNNLNQPFIKFLNIISKFLIIVNNSEPSIIAIDSNNRVNDEHTDILIYIVAKIFIIIFLMVLFSIQSILIKCKI